MTNGIISSKAYQFGEESLPAELPRSNIAVEDEVATQLADEATRANNTLYGFSNECMQAVLKILHEHGSVEEIYPYWLQTKMSKEFVGMPWLARGAMDFLIRELYPKNSEMLREALYNYGINLGNYFRIRANNFEELSKLLRQFRMSIPARLFELDRFEDEEGKGYILRYISGMSYEMTLCVAKYIQGAFSCFSSSSKSRIASGGMVELVIRVAE
jgi:hypothetical protein